MTVYLFVLHYRNKNVGVVYWFYKIGHISYSLGRHKIKFLLEQTKHIYKQHSRSCFREGNIDRFR